MFPDDLDCARPRHHSGFHSPDPDLAEPPHECPALPEKVHTVITVDATVGATVTEVRLVGAYEDYDDAVSHAAAVGQQGHGVYRLDISDRYVEQDEPAPGQALINIPVKTDLKVALVVPLQLLPDPAAEDAWAEEGRATALSPADYAGDIDEDQGDGE
jgi:hypothetical protein